MIELTQVSRHYFLGGEEIKALDRVDLSIPEGHFLALVGSSGSGKSTLLHLLGGLDQPDGGEIEIAGRNLSTLSDRQLAEYRRETVGFIFQTFHLIQTYTALENVMLPLQFTTLSNKDKKDRAVKSLQAVGLGERLRHKPSQLSGGQQQRVAIARSLINYPKLILADEPTGNLDSKNGAEIVDLLLKLNKKGITIVMVTHDLDIAGKAKSIVKVKDGHLIQ